MVFDSLRFEFEWRPYQERVLRAVDDHLNDKRLHIVAAPGAGKTVLGLEVFRKLASNTLVLSPTRIIRDQWIRRLSDFGIEGNPSDLPWVSTDLNQPRTLTSVTYQAVHAKASKVADESNEVSEYDDFDSGDAASIDISIVLDLIAENSIQVVILDEAHHLTAEWWKALKAAVSSDLDLTLVSLTATPPYDSL